MKTDFYTKFILTVIAIGLFANAGSNFISEARADFQVKEEAKQFVRVCGKQIKSRVEVRGRDYGIHPGTDCVEVKNGALLVKVVR